MFRVIFAGLLCTLYFTSCKKSDAFSPEAYHINFSAAAIDFIDIQPGKYFIYKDSATGTLDSVITTYRKLIDVYVPSGGTVFATPAYYYQQYNLNLSSNMNSNWLAVGASSDYNNTSATDTAALILSDISFMGPYFMYLHHYKDLPLPTVAIEGINYSNVLTQTRTNGQAGDPGFKQTTIWWAKNIGIIKRITIVGTNIKTQTLLRHN